MTVHPDAEAILHEGDSTAVLLCHGFTGSTKSMRVWADDLRERGFTVSAPRLPGHGTTWQEMNGTTWRDWYGELSREFERLRAVADRVFIAGLSLGGALTLRLAIDKGDAVAGVVVVNPAVKVEDIRLRALPLLKFVVPSLAGISNDIKKAGQDEGAYTRTPLRALHSQVQAWGPLTRELSGVTQPLLLFRSRVDHVVPASSSALVLERVSSTDVTEVVLEDSFHVATLDNDAPTIFEGTAAFIERVAAQDAS